MKEKAIIYILLVFPAILFGQQFPSPPSTSQMNNQMAAQHQQMMQQQQQLMRMMNNIQTDEQKLEKWENKKTKIELKINSLNDTISVSYTHLTLPTKA